MKNMQPFKFTILPAVIAGLTIFTTGCSYPKKASLYEKAEKTEAKAVVYVYRVDSVIDTANHDVPRFYINDQELGKLMLSGYYRAEIAAGPTEISYRNSLFGIPMWKSSRKLQFNAEASKVYYVKFSIETEMRFTKLVLVSKEKAEPEIKTTHLLVN